METSRLWSKNFVLVVISKTFSSTVFALLTATIVVYAVNRLGTSENLAGVASGAYVIASVPSRIFVGRHADRIGRKRSLLTGTFLYFIFTTAYFLPTGIIGLMAIRTVHGFFHGWSSNVHATVAVDCIPQNRMGEGMGYLSLSTTISTGLGPFVGILLLQSENYTTMFAACSIFSFLAFALLLFVDIREISTPKNPHGTNGHFNVSDCFDPKAMPLSVVILLTCACSSCITAFLVPYSTQEGSTDAAAFFFLVFAAIITISRPSFGKLMDRKGDNAAALPSFAAFIAALIVLCISTTKPALAIAATLSALGYGTLSPCMQAMITRDVSPSRVGIATSTFFVFTDLGLGLGPTLGGPIVSSFGYKFLFGTCSLLATTTLILYWAFHGKSHRRTCSPPSRKATIPNEENQKVD